MRRFLIRTMVLFACACLAAALWYFKVRSLVRQHGDATSTQLLFGSVGDADREVLRAVYLVINLSSGRRATGLLVSGGFILTDAHAVAGAHLSELDVFSSGGQKVPLRGLEVDTALDVAFLRPAAKLDGGLELEGTGSAGPGDQVYTWGYPSNVEPPLPLLSMGFVSGYREVRGEPGTEPSPRLVLGGPFSEGNGGGPLYRWKDSALVGLVVARPPAEDPFVARALKALGGAVPGQTVEVADERGRTVKLTQNELLARVLARVREGGPQVVEALPLETLRRRLSDMR